VQGSAEDPNFPLHFTRVEQPQHSAMATTSSYPLSRKEELIKRYVGKSLKDVPTPAAVLDLSKLKNNCNRMLEACDQLDFGWRAHIKTHKVSHVYTKLLYYELVYERQWFSKLVLISCCIG
jgi:hypothetical protein